MKRFRLGLLPFVLVFSTAAAVRSPDWEGEYRKARHATLFETPDAAVQIVESALRRAGDSDDPWVLALRLYRAEMKAMKGGFREALPILARPLPVPLRKTEIEIRRLGALAMVLHSTGRSVEARAITDRMVALASKDIPAMAADAYYMRGNLNMDEADVRTAVRLAKANGDPILEMRSEALLVRAFHYRGRHAEAVEVGERVLPRLEKAGLSGAGTIAGNIASAYFWLGDYESSRELFLRAEAMARRLGTAHDLPVWLDRLGDVHLAMHDPDGAARSYAQAEQLAREHRHRQLPRALANLARIAIARGQLAYARCYIDEAAGSDPKQDEWDDVGRTRVIRASLEIALGNFDAARKELESVIDTSKNRLTRLRAETELGRLYAAQKKNDRAGAYFARAMKTAVDERGEIPFDYRFSFFNSVQDLFDTYVDFLVESRQIGKALEITEESRARMLAEGLGAIAPKKKLDPPAVAKRANATILAYWLGTRHSYVWAVTPTGVAIRRLPPAAEIERDVELYQKVLEHGSLSDSAPRGQRLYQTLVASAVRTLPPGSRVIIIPDGKLHSLNFETLVVPAPRPRWWIDDVIVSSGNSLHLLGRPTAKRTAEPALLLVGDAPRADPAFGPLPNAGAEMAKVGAHFRRRKVLSGAAATPKAFLQAAPASFDVIHFVAHGIATRRQPLDSAVILGRDDTNRYRLLARDIVSQPLTARLVTISSCHGAGTRAYSGEGLVGLAWAFLRAGAEQVIAALWKVDDAATTKLMNHMYAQIRAGRDPAVALRDAKRALIHSGTSQQKPRYWAPFVIYAGS
ncbi:MAG TPA: CHAT domain-containing protein [Thermoanaerobaculia bacterium]